jgi:hypothetical protein
MTDVTSNESKAGRCLLLVHGKDFKPGAEDYFDFALAALSTAVDRDFPDEADDYHSLAKRLCYYGDLTNELLASFGEHYDEVLDLGDRRNALGQLKLLQKPKHFGVSRYDRLPGKTAATEFFADVTASLMTVLGFSKPLVARMAKDVSEYWYGKGNFAESIRTRVRARICEALDQEEKILLLSHGTGTIVAYDVLWQLSHDDRFKEKYADQKIDTWVTLGSPLGDSLVRRKLMGASEKGRHKYPSNVVTWHNLSAEDDYLCHDNSLADDFRTMLKQRLVSSIRDYKIYNMAVRYGKSNPHSSIGYYIHPRMARIMIEWLKSDPVAPTPQNIF